MASKKSIADMLGVSVSFIDTLIDDGVLERGIGRGGMRETDVMKGIGKFAHASHRALRDAGINTQGIPADALEEEAANPFQSARIQNILADTRLKELKEAEIRGEQARIDLLRDVLARVGQQIYGVLEGIPGAIARRCPDVSPGTMELIKKELALALNAAADAEIRDEDLEV